MSKPRLLAYIALLANTFLWALAIPIVKLGFQHGLDPIIFLFFRFLLATLLSLPFIPFILHHHPQSRSCLKLKNLGKIALLEFLGTFVALWFLYEGVARTTGVAASLIAITWPIFVTFGGIWFLREKEEKHEWFGFTLTILGTILLVARPLLQNSRLVTTHLTGNSFILIQNLIIASYYILAKKHYQGLNKWLITHLSFWVGAISFGGIILIQKSFNIWPSLNINAISHWSSNPWPLIAILYMAIFGSILGLTLYLLGQDKIEASEAALFTYLQPIFSIPATIILLKETVSPIEITALAIIIFGIWWAEKR